MQLPTPTPTKTRIATSRGLYLNVDMYGPNDGPTCIALHGFGDGAYVWAPLAQALPHWRLLAVDLRGHGDSGWDKAGTYNLAAHLSDIDDLIKSLPLDQFAIIGHSLGGRVALNTASRHKSKVIAAVTVDFGLAMSTVGQDRALADFLASFRPFETRGAYEAWLLGSRPMTSAKYLSYFSAHSLKIEDGHFINKCDPRLAHYANNADGDNQLPVILPTLRCPILVVRGIGSAVFPTRSAQLTVNHLRYGEALNVSAAGHAVVTENPDELAAKIADFLRPHTRRATPAQVATSS